MDVTIKGTETEVSHPILTVSPVERNGVFAFGNTRQLKRINCALKQEECGFSSTFI